MITVIVPTIDKHSGLETCNLILKRICLPESQKSGVVVIDDYGVDEVTRVSNVVIIGLGTHVGSYAARNIGANYAKDAKQLIFVDDGVRLLDNIEHELLFKEGIRGVKVCFDREPANRYEYWYCVNAFPVEYFLKVYSFIPTIFLMIDSVSFRKVGRFNEQLFSAGDYEFCKRATEYSVKINIENIYIETHLRTKEQVFKKIKRQIYGQAYKTFLSKQNVASRLYLIVRALYNLFALSGHYRKDPRFGWPIQFLTNYEISLRKARYLLHSALFLSKEQAYFQMSKANKQEINKWDKGSEDCNSM